MTAITSTQLQRDIDILGANVIALTELTSIDGYGIVSTVPEAVTPDQLAVRYNADTDRIEVTAGTFVTPEGQVCVVHGDVTDLIWPLEPLLYVAVYSDITSIDTTDRFQQTVNARTVPEFKLAVVDSDALISMGNSAVVVAVLRRSDELNEVDTTNLVLADNRHVFSPVDVWHRSVGRDTTDPRNPHGVGLDEVAIGGVSLLRQIHAAGFVAGVTEGAAGVHGTQKTVTLTNAAQQDPVGRIVPPGHYYVRLAAYPTQAPVVKSVLTGLPVQFTWAWSTNILDFGFTDPGDITVDYFSVPDVEIQGTGTGPVTQFRGTDTAAVITDGAITTPAAGSVDVSAFASMAMELDVVIGADGSYQVIPEIVASLQPSKSKVPATSFPYKPQLASRLAVAVTGSELYGRVPPPLGRLDVLNTAFVGRYQFMYTISVPETVVPLFLYDTGFGSRASWVPFPGGSLSRSGKAVDRRYFNVVDNTIYLESRAYNDRYSYTYTVPASESSRFYRGYTEKTGTTPKPTGVAAKGSVVFLGMPEIGDAVNVRFEASNPIVRKAYGTDFSGSTPADAAASLASALNADLLFALKAKAVVSGSTVKVTATALGSEGNAYTITVDGSALSSKFAITTFAGGTSYTPVITDVTGAVLRVSQPNQGFPDGALINIYMTDNLDETGDSNLFYKVTSIPMLSGVHSYDFVIDEDTATAIDTKTVAYDLTKKFKMSVTVTGTDGTGASVTDTLDLQENTVFEVQNFGDPLQFVLTKSIYASVTGIVVTESANVGTAKAVVMAQALARDSSRSRIAEITTDRERITAIHDRRSMHPAGITPDPVTHSDALVFGLALSEVQ